MPGGRRGRLALTLPSAAVAVALAYLSADAVQPAGSASIAHAAIRQGPSWSSIVAAKRTAPYGIAFFGDSVSVGFGASDRGHGYVARVSSWLRTSGRRVVATVNAKGGVPVAYWEYAAIPKKLDAAVVELGTNDVRLGTSAVQFAREYRTLISRIRAANPKTHILCLSVWSRSRGTALERIINGQIRGVCPGGYVDITRLRNRWHIRSSDGFHPNDVGYLLIARAVESKLKTG